MIINVRATKASKLKVNPVGVPVSGWLGTGLGLGEAEGLGIGDPPPPDGSGEASGLGLGAGLGDAAALTNWVITNSKSS